MARALGWMLASIIIIGCGDSRTADPDGDDPGVDSGRPVPGRDAGAPPEGDDAGPGGTDSGRPPIEARSGIRCGSPAPEGAAMPPPLPAYSGGVCPTLAPGMNVIRSGGSDRRFILVAPADHDPATETLPLVVMWHHIGGEADSLVGGGEVQLSADTLRFIAVVPEKKGDLAMDIFGYEFDPAWPYLTSASDARVEEEAVFFDDMVTCVTEQLATDTSCISSAGISAGALWTSQLAQLRAERLASIVVLSGGTGPATSVSFLEVRDWSSASHAMPALIAWGGTPDQCGVNFDTASRNVERGLDEGGHFVMECIHNCGHGAPPVDPEAGLRVLWGFALDHPYWLRDGESSYLVDGMRPGTPEWCGMGVGTAVPRTGMCREEGPACPVPAL